MVQQLKQIEIELNDPIEAHIRGEAQVCKVVVLTAPASKHRSQVARIKNFCAYHVDRHITARTKPDTGGGEKPVKAPAEDDDGFTGETLMTILALADIEDKDAMETVYNLFQKIIVDGCGSVEGVTMNAHLFDKLSFEDLERMFGEYVVTFLLSSLVN